MALRLTLLTCLLFSGLFAQQPDIDTVRYVETYPTRLTWRNSLTSTGNSFVLRDTELGTDLTLNPERSVYFHTSLQFRALELGFGFSPAWLNPDRDLEGARLFNLDFRLYTGRWMHALTYVDQVGFRADFEGIEFPFPDFASRKVGGTTSFVLNRRFSFRAIHSQNEWQMKSAGSFVPRMMAYYTRYQLTTDAGSETQHSFDLGLGPGYHYNWVLGKHWLISAGVTAGLGFNILELEEGTNTYWLWETQFRSTLGYNSDTLFAGIGGQYTFYEHGAGSQTRLDDRIHYVQAYLGYRFRAPDSWNRAADRINRKFGWD
jgi:hypothetical protein